MAAVSTAERRVFCVDPGGRLPADASAETVGGKAFNLMRLAAMGLQVPSAFVLSVDFCQAFLAGGRDAVPELREALLANVRALEERSGLVFGDARRPLLLSARSGAARSMPGMMDTVLNVGLCEHTLRGLIRQTGNTRLAWDCYRRLVQAFAEIVHGGDPAPFEAATRRAVVAQEVDSVRELDSAGLEDLTQEFLRIFSVQAGVKFPQDPVEQLVAVVEAVFRSWQGPRAVQYRRMNGLGALAGTAVTVQTMVFGNGGIMSGSGVGFTRDPALGGNALYVDFLPNAQGEDVVSGRQSILHPDQLQGLFPAIHRKLEATRVALEKEFRDVQEFEFTVQEGKLYMLQTRRAKRTGWAALRHAVDMVDEGVIDPAEALRLLADYDLRQLVRDRLAPRAGEAPICRASPASFGIAVGGVAFDAQRAREMAESGKPVILIREDLATADLDGIAAAAGIVTARGARTSHAAVVARQLNKVCLVGCADLAIDTAACKARLSGYDIAEGDTLSLDGESGAIYLGEVPVVRERPVDLLRRVEAWRAIPAREPAEAPG